MGAVDYRSAGTQMADLEIRLRCTNCKAFQPFDREAGNTRVVSCASCGKRHSVDSLHAVDPADMPAFDD